MILTKQIFEHGKSSNNGWNGLQLKILGVTQPLPKGWRASIIGKDFPEDIIKKFIELKDYHFINKSTGEIRKRQIISFVPVFKSLSYSEQYIHPNWQKMRLFILNRDKFTCVDCKSINNTLHVHHLKYLRGKNIWEVPTWYLVTLCDACHSKEHGRDLTINKK